MKPSKQWESPSTHTNNTSSGERKIKQPSVDNETPDKVDLGRRKFLQTAKELAILGAGASIMPEELFSAKRKRSKEKSLPTREQYLMFAKEAQHIATRPEMRKFALETKNIPKNILQMRKVLNDIENKTPGKVDELKRLAHANGIDFAILFAIGVVESDWNPHKIGKHSKDPEAGIMQIKLDAAASVGYKESTQYKREGKGDLHQLTGLYDPATNLEYAIKYFGYIFQYSPHIKRGNIADMLGHYNQGPGYDTAKNLRKVPKGPQRAKEYSNQVMAVFHYYTTKYADSNLSDDDLYVEAANISMTDSPLYAKSSDRERAFYGVDRNKLPDPKASQKEKKEIVQLFSRMNSVIRSLGKAGQLGALRVKHDIDLSIIYALIAVESQWNPDTNSADGNRIGLMRVDKNLAQKEGFTGDLYDPVTNIDIGMTQLRKILNTTTSGDLFEALYQYNHPNASENDDSENIKKTYHDKFSTVLYYYYNRRKLME